MRKYSLQGICIFLLLAIASGAQAQATRTWVSGVGDDANPCSRTAPCKTFAGAISKTAANGIINAIDNGAFGVVTITKSITIDAVSQTAGVLGSSTNGIIVNALSTDRIVLRGIQIKSTTSTLNGVRILNGSVSIENCTIDGFSVGVDVEPSASATLAVIDSVIRSNASNGILVKPVSPATVKGVIDNVQLIKNGGGIRVEDRGDITVRNTTASSNGANGFVVFSASAPARMIVDRSAAVSNGANGFNANGAQASLFISNSISAFNTSAGFAVGSGALFGACFENRQFGNGAASPASSCPGGSTF